MRYTLMTILALLTVYPCRSAVPDLAKTAGVSGGVLVRIGCDEPVELMDICIDDTCLVQAIDTDPEKVAAARAAIPAEKYGRVSAILWDGKRLPYVDNFVNLIVVPGVACRVSSEEIRRVLAPRGVAIINLKSAIRTPQSKVVRGWRTYRKPVPDGIDDWTHFLHSPGNNAVASDRIVAPPRSMQWVGGPRYARHHDKMSSVSAVVSADGRVFSIVDLAPPVSILTPPQWTLVARDAFNGTVLWRRPVTKWHPHMHGLKSGPADLPRKLVAVGNRVYVTLEIYGPVHSLDATTGKTLHTYEGTAGAEEILVADNTLFVQVNEARLAATKSPPRGRKKAGDADFADPVRTILALDAKTGEQRWALEHTVLSGTLAVGNQHVVFVGNDRVHCLDRANGKALWQSEPVPRQARYPTRFTPTLVLYEDVVLFAGGELAGEPKRGNRSWDIDKNDTLTALSADTGKVLWKTLHPHSGYASSEDVLVVNGVVWVGETTGGAAVGTFKGHDVRTGKVLKQFDPDVETYWFHHRCYRGKATENFLIMSRTGTEFIDFNKEHWDINHWLRGACLYGLMPANGLLYAPQHPCACFLESKQYGFNALAGRRREGQGASNKGRLEKGPAFAQSFETRHSTRDTSRDWPTFRGDNARSGRAATKLPADLEAGWSTEVGGKLSAATVADGRIYVASIDRHTVHALSCETGKTMWTFTAGGRVDSPPTCWRNRVVFGSADGHVYCLTAADGKLAWRFRAAPTGEQTMAFGQIESVWPVHGSVLIEDDILCFVAGRSIFLDGGLRLFRMSPGSGEVLSVTILDEMDRDANRTVQDYARQLNMPTALPDVLSCDDRHLYMRAQPFTREGKRLPLEALEYTAQDPERFGITVIQKPEHAHLFSPTGFLDDSWWHRTYWVYGSHFYGGWSGYTRAGKVTPAGKLLVMDDKHVYGFGRKLKFYRWTTPIEHMLFAASRDLVPVIAVKGALAKGTRNPRAHKWAQDIPLFARAMLLSGDTLFLAGPEDVVNEEQAVRKLNDPQTRTQIVRQSEMFSGLHGGTMWAVNKNTGDKLEEWKLDTIPVFNGMAAADGRLYLAGADGRVTCFK